MTDKQLAILIKALFAIANQLVYALWFVAMRHKSDTLPESINGFGLEGSANDFLDRHLMPQVRDVYEQHVDRLKGRALPKLADHDKGAPLPRENPQAWNGPKTWGQLMELGYKADVSRPDSWGNCNKCGMRVFWVLTPKGKRMPLEAVSSTEFDVHFAKCPRK